MCASIIIITFIVTILVDLLYLNMIKDIFKKQIENIQSSQVKIKLLGGLLTYIFIVAGLYYFIIKQNKGPKDAFILGIVIYGIYELTNYSLFSKWEPKIVVMDTIWGGILFAIVTFIINKIKKYIM
jgi:uncharacterized membrane protein